MTLERTLLLGPSDKIRQKSQYFINMGEKRKHFLYSILSISKQNFIFIAFLLSKTYHKHLKRNYYASVVDDSLFLEKLYAHRFSLKSRTCFLTLLKQKLFKE